MIVSLDAHILDQKTMTIEYSIDEHDFLTYQLYTASRSPVVRKRRFKSKVIFAMLYLLTGVLFLLQEKIILGASLTLLAILWFILYPLHDKRVYVRNYQNFIHKNYKDKLGRKAFIQFDNKQITTKDEAGQSKFAIRDVEEVTEIPQAIYVKLKKGQSFILPKNKIADVPALVTKLKEIAETAGFRYNDQPQWVWK